ncbi:MAG TPA: hypothetical protein VFE65_30705 [Pseudonocardia sp.]|jgi:hypothetical protein|nr:hypothetical protein [Pseudonocardia sp.]
MYELSRVRLFSVGPPGARYQDVCLDLSGVGSRVEPGGSVDLFESDSRPPRRPSPASVLFLENGGGKSVLLKLIFSVLLPGRRQVVGTSNTRVLEKFVLGEDVSHVALEWMHTVTGQRVVTGKVSEWRGHVVSNDPAKLIDAWYSFHPTPAFGLDELPVTQDRRRVSLAGFRDRLEEAQQREPALHLTWETVHRQWSGHLVELGLDPELFRYQRAMNAGEGEAADVFAFPTDEAFVDFLLRAVVDPEEPRGLAEVVAGYAAKITERADLQLEHDFVAGMLERLGPLAAAEHEADVARAAEESALDAVRSLAGSVTARKALEDERLVSARAAVQEAADGERAATTRERRLADAVTELRRRVAMLSREVAEAVHGELTEEKARAVENLAAWQAVEPVLRDRLASAEAGRLRRVVSAEQDKAQPVLLARQRAASALAAALRLAAHDADRTATGESELAAESASRADRSRSDELRWAGQAAEHRAASDQARVALARIRDQVADAIDDGWLTEGEDPLEAHERAAAREIDAARAMEELLAEFGALRSARRGAQERLDAARVASSSQASLAESARTVLREAQDVASALAAEPRLAELMGVEAVELDQDAQELGQLLRAAIESADQRRAELHAESRVDARAIEALGAGGLLPVADEVEQALTVLEKAGIAASPGWRFLARLDETARAEVIERLPHLVSGIVLGDPGDVDRARAELLNARLLPRTPVAVGTDESLRGTASATAAFVVAPNPAMYDEDTAGRVRGELREANAVRRRLLGELDARLELDRALLERLRRLLAEYPPGRHAELAASAEAAEQAEGEARGQVDSVVGELAELDARSEHVDARLPELRDEEHSARERAARLVTLRGETERRPELTELIRRANTEAEVAEARADEARNLARQAREQEQEHVRASDRHLAVAATVRAELTELPDDVLDETHADAVTVEQGEPLSVLRAQYRAADSAYAAAEVDADLRAALGAAERAAEATRSAVLALPERVRARADELLRSSDGSEVSSRRAATEQAERALRAVEAGLQTAHTELALATRTVNELPVRPGALDHYPAPSDIDEGESLIEQGRRDHADAEAAVLAARGRHQAAMDDESAIDRSRVGFGSLLSALDELAEGGTDSDADPFTGDVDAAMTRWTQLRTTLRGSAGTRQERETRVRKAADDVALHAQDARFGTVTSPVRRHVLGVSRAQMPAFAEDWQRALRPRLRSLSDDLSNIGRHRSGIVTRLRGMVAESLRTLRLAGKLSELPEGLSDWSGQQFLRIRFEEMEDEDEVIEALGEVVDRTAQGYQSGGKEQRDGVSLLLRGVRAVMPKGVRVEMLKPDAVLRAERLRVSEIRDVFSGGQQLTAAIVLYCTMAALRANQRGEGRQSHAGLLFLDNPIGRASASYLLELQFGVAEALGVQLIYTTGLFDAGALSAFPLIIRLRNDADLRAGRKYLTVDDHVARVLARLPEEDGSGSLSAARIFRRPREEAVSG